MATQAGARVTTPSAEMESPVKHTPGGEMPDPSGASRLKQRLRGAAIAYSVGSPNQRESMLVGLTFGAMIVGAALVLWRNFKS